ncbi:MAG: DegT/DnrJ/EryC1/StrS family aminotransferase, partial [bacterium]
MAEELALDGGEPTAPEGIPYHRPSVGEAEAREISKCLESRYIVGPGPYCEKVESYLEDGWDIPRSLTVTSCTHALELALIALDLPPEAEVVVPSFTYVST